MDSRCTMTGLRLYKKEKLCSVTAIEQLFSAGRSDNSGEVHSVMAYPWRCVWRCNSRRELQCPKFLISVPKKRLRHAVDRVKMRRRMREAYRLSRHMMPMDTPVDMVIIYVADTLTDYAAARRAMHKIARRITDTLLSDSAAND